MLAADEAGLQIAMHAIGDRAVRTALDSLELAAERRAARGDHAERRHRIEHLEYVDEADVPRLAHLGVTASMQPVHCDPAGLANWIDVLGADHRTRARLRLARVPRLRDDARVRHRHPDREP